MGKNREKGHTRRPYLRGRSLKKEGFKSITQDCFNIIQILKKEEPLKRSQIMKLTGIPQGSLDRRLTHLRAIGSITLKGKKYSADPEPDITLVRRVMKQLKKEGFHHQSVNTLSNMTGLTLERADKAARYLAPYLKITVGDRDIKTDASVII